jgi:hypothetical protein
MLPSVLQHVMACVTLTDCLREAAMAAYSTFRDSNTIDSWFSAYFGTVIPGGVGAWICDGLSWVAIVVLWR